MSICDVPGISTFCHAATDSATNVFAGVVTWVADALSDVAAALIRGFWTIFETTTFVDITSGRFTAVYNIVFGIAVFVMIGFFLLQVIGGVIRREPAALSRAVFGLAKSVLGSFVVVTLIAAALQITDQLSVGIIEATGTTAAQMGDRLDLLSGAAGVGLSTGPAGALLLALFLAGLAVAAGFIVWLSLLVRKALLLVAIVFAPVALAGATWDATRGWIGRWAQFVLALVVSKLVMTVFFLLAAQQISAPIDADLASFADPLAGIVLMLVAGFAPYLTYKAISFMGIDFYHAMSTEQEAKQALNRPVPVPPNPLRRTPPRVFGGSGSGSDAGVSAGGFPPPGAQSGVGGVSGPTSGGTTAAGAGSGAGAGVGAAGAAASGVGIAAAGAVIAKEGATAGPRIGATVGGHASQQSDASRDPGGSR